MEEIWKDIKGYEGLYQVSNLGRVKSLEKFHANKTVGYITKDKILKNRLSGQRENNKYYSVMLYKNHISKSKRVHVLVAEAFILNNEDKPFVNHKDGNKLNNCVNNLEWCTAKENTQHAFKNGLNFIGKGKANRKARVIYQYTLEGKLIKKWYGVREINRELNINYGNIDACLRNQRKSAGGYVWKLGK